ncbi:hypothetical protein IWW38_004919, partial [Coemansia aciculifera]
MNLLLPAAAQYMTQQPRRPATPQVQVFYPKPSPPEESTARKANSARRHSYQVPPEGPNLATDMDGMPSRSRQVSGNRRRSTNTGIVEEPDDDNDELEVHDSQLASVWPSSSVRRRSATVARVSNDDVHNRGNSTTNYPPVPPPPHSARVAQSAGSVSQAGGSDLASAGPASKPTVASRASNIIPSITRRLGLGFGFRSNASRIPSGKEGQDTAVTTDEDDRPTPTSPNKPRTTSMHVADNKGARAPIPAELVTDRSAKRDGLAKPAALGRRRISGAKVGGLADAHYSGSVSDSELSSSSESSSISIDTGGESDSNVFGGVDDQPPYRSGGSRIPPSNWRSTGRNSFTLPDNATRSPGTSSTHMDLLMSSPMRTSHSLALQGRSRARLTAGFDDSTDGVPDSSARASMFGSTRQPHVHLRRDSSTEDDELNTHEPDLHFDQSDSGSDAENIAGSV